MSEDTKRQPFCNVAAYLCDAFRISNSVIPTGLDVLLSEGPPYL